MENSDAPRLIAAPRHLRRRVFHEEISDQLLVPEAEPLPVEVVPPRGAKRPTGSVSARIRGYGRKRAVALLAVILVSVSIPLLVLALIFAG